MFAKKRGARLAVCTFSVGKKVVHDWRNKSWSYISHVKSTLNFNDLTHQAPLLTTCMINTEFLFMTSQNITVMT